VDRLIAGYRRFFAMSTTWDRFDMAEQTMLSDTGPLVVRTHVHARSRATGRELDFPILQTIICGSCGHGTTLGVRRAVCWR
jgi:hypothetical protein